MGSHPPLGPADDPSANPQISPELPTPPIPVDASESRLRVAPVQSASERQTLLRLASAGFELASFSLILGGAGYAIDHWMSFTTPYVAIVGVLVGFCLGFYRLIVLASKMN